MDTKTYPVIVAGTGFEGRAERIRANCKDGARIDLRREPGNKFDANAIGVWMSVSHFFGLWRPWSKIGYIPASRAKQWAPKMDSGSMSFVQGHVHSFDAYPGVEHPRVSTRLTFDIDR